MLQITPKGCGKMLNIQNVHLQTSNSEILELSTKLCFGGNFCHKVDGYVGLESILFHGFNFFFIFQPKS